jgi:Undecaprenyl-phosphate glucose phosphotransferase
MKKSCVQVVGAFDCLTHSLRQFPETVDDCDRNALSVRKLVDLCRAARVDDVVLVAPPEQLETIPQLAITIAEMPVSLHVVPRGSVDLLASAKLSELGGIATIQVLHLPLSAFDKLIKRAFDLLVASAALVILAPVLLMLSVAIKLESHGPVLFRQKRHGYNNETIRIFKLRTMYVIEDGPDFTQATRHDPRVTRVGRTLRSTNADELPQLLNVIRGEMSLVGPRPQAIAHNRRFENQIMPYWRRHNVKPGITGWAQVNGYRGETDTREKMQRRIEHDLHYIENWSFLFDLKIIVLTVVSRKSYSNAH